MSALDVQGLCALLGCDRRFVYRNCSRDLPDPWPHMRLGDGPKAALRFTPEQIAQIQARLSVTGRVDPPPVPVSDAALAKALRRLAA